MQICLVYDHLYPHTVGGVERWFRDLALRLVAAGHDVTYLTMRHWDEGDEPSLPGVRVLGLTGRMQVYRSERRTLLPPLAFGLAVAGHLFRRGGDYDVVHTSSFPYFPLLAAGALRRRGRYAIVVDWAEIWTPAYWRRYAGAAVGSIGSATQRLCARIPQRAFCYSRMHARRLVALGVRGEVTVLPGIYSGPAEATPAERVDPLVVYAGRHVAEKRVPALVRAFALVAESRPDLRLELYGDGPERSAVEALVGELGLAGRVAVHGRRPEEEVADALGRAACLATASEREGYGLVVVEAAARGTPSVVVAGPENAATELVQEGVNGAIARSASPADMAAAILTVVEAGPKLRASTAAWFEDNVDRLRLDRSLDAVLEAYRLAPS